MMLSQPYARGGTSHAMLTEPASGGPLPSLTRKGLLVISKRPISGAGVTDYSIAREGSPARVVLRNRAIRERQGYIGLRRRGRCGERGDKFDPS